MYKDSLVTIEDLSNGQIEDILDLAQEIEADRDAFHGLASRQIMASLFLEPSTRTRGSFEAAMKRLGGDTVTVADAGSSSMSKGESLADTIRVWSGYSDLIVLRHPWEGSTRLAVDYSDVPVINAGDGSHEHPTQTLLDLYTLRKEFGSLAGLKIILCGDLKNGRTIHSLIYALLRFGSAIIFAPGEDLDLPQHVFNKILTEYDRPMERIHHPGITALYGQDPDDTGQVVDAIYMTPSQPHSLTFLESAELHIGDESLAFYVTRRQAERETTQTDGPAKRYPRIDARVLKMADFSNAVILHPLPRVDELSPAIDSDRRSKYFEQAHNGVPVRMALITLLLGLAPWKRGPEQSGFQPKVGPALSDPKDIRCENPECVTLKEPYNATAQFTIFQRPRVRFVCGYCHRETHPSYYAYPWGEVYYPAAHFPDSEDACRFVFFRSAATARASGLRLPKKSEVRV